MYITRQADHTEFRIIPGYERYSVNRYGVIKDNDVGGFVSQTPSNGYMCTTLKYNDGTPYLKQRLVPVHRLVGLAWLPKPDNVDDMEINHKDGDKTNNTADNLEWVTKTENANHASKYLNYRSGTKMKCRTRDFQTGEVVEHDSVQQAVKHMGYTVTTGLSVLCPKMFGKLLRDRYEFRLEEDKRPWFYENRTQRVLSRYMIVLTYPDGKVKEYFSKLDLIKAFRLYNIDDKSIENVVKVIGEQCPDISIKLYDAYTIDLGIPRFHGSRIQDTHPVYIVSDKVVIKVESYLTAANIFRVPATEVRRRVNTLETLKGYIIIQDEHIELIEMHRLRDKYTDTVRNVPLPSDPVIL